MKKVLLALIACFISSCMSTKNLQKKLNKENLNINLLYPIKTNNIQKKMNIKLAVTNNTQIIETTVTKNSSHFIPLLIINSKHVNYQIRLGQQNISDKISETIYTGLINQSNRVGKFNISRKSNYILKIDINEFDFQTKFKEKYFSIGGFSKTSRFLKPEQGIINIEATLYNNKGAIIFDKKYSTDITARFVNDEEILLNSDLRKTINKNFMDSVNMSIEKSLNIIISDINILVETLANTGQN